MLCNIRMTNVNIIRRVLFSVMYSSEYPHMRTSRGQC